MLTQEPALLGLAGITEQPLSEAVLCVSLGSNPSALFSFPHRHSRVSWLHTHRQAAQHCSRCDVGTLESPPMLLKTYFYFLFMYMVRVYEHLQRPEGVSHHRDLELLVVVKCLLAPWEMMQVLYNSTMSLNHCAVSQTIPHY